MKIQHFTFLFQFLLQPCTDKNNMNSRVYMSQWNRFFFNKKIVMQMWHRKWAHNWVQWKIFKNMRTPVIKHLTIHVHIERVIHSVVCKRRSLNSSALKIILASLMSINSHFTCMIKKLTFYILTLETKKSNMHAKLSYVYATVSINCKKKYIHCNWNTE